MIAKLLFYLTSFLVVTMANETVVENDAIDADTSSFTHTTTTHHTVVTMEEEEEEAKEMGMVEEDKEVAIIIIHDDVIKISTAPTRKKIPPMCGTLMAVVLFLLMICWIKFLIYLFPPRF